MNNSLGLKRQILRIIFLFYRGTKMFNITNNQYSHSEAFLDLQEKNISDDKIQKLCTDLIEHSFTKVSFLNLVGNNISSEGMKHLCKFLSHCKSIESIDLTRNPIGDEGLKYLAEFIKTTHSLKQLMILNINITEEGLNHLADALKVNTSLSFINLACNNLTTQAVENFSKKLDEKATNYPEILFQFKNEAVLDDSSYTAIIDRWRTTTLRKTAETLLLIKKTLNSDTQKKFDSKTRFFNIKPLVFKVLSMIEPATSEMNQSEFINFTSIKKN